MKKRVVNRISVDMRNAANHILQLLPDGIGGRMVPAGVDGIPAGLWVSGGLDCHAISGDWAETGSQDPDQMGALDFVKMPGAVAYAFAKDEDGNYIHLPAALVDAGWGDAEQALCQQAEDATTVCEVDPETGEYSIPDAGPQQIVICVAQTRLGLNLLGMARKPEEEAA